MEFVLHYTQPVPFKHLPFTLLVHHEREKKTIEGLQLRIEEEDEKLEAILSEGKNRYKAQMKQRTIYRLEDILLESIARLDDIELQYINCLPLN